MVSTQEVSSAAVGIRALRARPEEWARRFFSSSLAEAGVELNGTQPWDPRLHRAGALARILVAGSLGAGEAYVDGDWDCDAIDELFARLIKAGIDRRVTHPMAAAAEVVARVANRQTPARAWGNSIPHYDRGLDLYEAMLGRTLAYSCGYWREADTLDEAQDAKHDLVCRKLHLERGQRVLDIGCGFGGFARHAAERYGVSVTGVTVSPSQAETARTRCAGLPVEIVLQDYRDIEGRFDRVVSIGMFEHVGPLNYRTFFEKATSVLAPDGLFLLHCIGSASSTFTIDPWLHRYIFPNAVLPSAAQIARAAEGLALVEDWHNFGVEYDKTLMAWCANFDAAWPRLRAQYDERFRRMWRYYLLSCAGTFRAFRNQLWQIVFSKSGVPGGYRRCGA